MGRDGTEEVEGGFSTSWRGWVEGAEAGVSIAYLIKWTVALMSSVPVVATGWSGR